MFLSVSGHSSELSIANHSSRPTVSQLKCVSDTISSSLENHQPQKPEISTVFYAPFIQNSNQMASRLTANTSFPRVFFQLLQFSRQRPSFSAQRAALMTKTDLIFPAFSSRLLNFALRFCFRCKFSFHEKRRSSLTVSGLTVATPRVPLFCSYHILTSSVIYYWTDARQHGIYLLISY